MRFDELNENNYMLFAIKFYDNPHALTKEAGDDPPVRKKKKYIYGGRGSRRMWMQKNGR